MNKYARIRRGAAAGLLGLGLLGLGLGCGDIWPCALNHEWSNIPGTWYRTPVDLRHPIDGLNLNRYVPCGGSSRANRVYACTFKIDCPSNASTDEVEIVGNQRRIQVKSIDVGPPRITWVDEFVRLGHDLDTSEY